MPENQVKTPDKEHWARVVAPSRVKYLGDQIISATGYATFPEGTDMVSITCNTATVRFRINAQAGASAGSVVAEGNTHYLPPISNLTSLHLYVDGGQAHLMYWQSM